MPDTMSDHPAPEPHICSNSSECCRELSRVWEALGVTTYLPGRGSCSEQVAALRAEVAQLRQERDLANVHNTSWARDFKSLAAKLDAAEARLATLTEKVTEYETRPWPGCRVLSLGDACDCSLCQSEHKLAALTAALDGLELELLDHAHSYEEQIEGTTAEDFEFMSDLSKLVAGWADRLAALRT